VRRAEWIVGKHKATSEDLFPSTRFVALALMSHMSEIRDKYKRQ